MADFFAEIGNIFNDIIQNVLDFLWDMFLILIHMLFGWINVPPFPVELQESINSFLDLIFENLSLLGFFVRSETLNIVIPLVAFIFSFKYIYKLVMWIVRKIPFVNIN